MKTDFWKKIATNELINLYERHKDNNLETVPVTLARISDALLIAVPGELFVEYGLKVKRFLKDKYGVILIIELANGYVGYIPTKEAFNSKNGGYEIQFLTTSKTH